MAESRRVGINRVVAGSPDAAGCSQFFVGRMFWTYILENPEGRFYIGQTDNLTARLDNHNRTDVIGGKFTRKIGPWKLVWTEPHPTRSAAMLRERQIKKMKSARWIRNTLLKGGGPKEMTKTV